MKVRAASKTQSRGRWAFVGPSGSGKTWTGLIWAHVLARQPDGTPGRIAVIDSERGSAEKYAGEIDPRLGVPFAFDVITLDDFSPDEYIAGINFAEQRKEWKETIYTDIQPGEVGYHVLIVDSLSPAWAGHEGVLEQLDKEIACSRTKNKFDAWRVATPMHNRLVNALLQSDLHLIVTLRTNTEWVVEKGDDGKSKPRKIGLAPIQRPGLEYEFDVMADMDNDQQNMVVSKSRVPGLTGLVVNRPGPEVAEKFREWLQKGSPQPGPSIVVATPTPPPAPTVKVESETKVPVEMKKELASLIRDLGLAVFDGGAGKPYLVAMPPAVLAVLGLPENSPPVDAKTFGIGAYAAIMPVLRMLHSTRSAEIDKAIEEAGDAVTEEAPVEMVLEVGHGRIRADLIGAEDAERGVVE